MAKKKMNSSKTKILVIAYIGVFLFLTLILLIVRSIKTPANPPETIFPTPFPTSQVRSLLSVTPVQSSADLSIKETYPKDKALNIPLRTEVIISFNKNIEQAPPFSLLPVTEFSTSVNANTLTISPKKELDPGTEYSIVLRLSKNSGGYNLYSFSFTTAGPTPTPFNPNTSTDVYNQTEEFQKEKYPDIFLANKTPYSTNDFSITSELVKNPEHFRFIVILKGNTEASKSKFISWLSSLGLTNGQIQGLDIAYQ